MRKKTGNSNTRRMLIPEFTNDMSGMSIKDLNINTCDEIFFSQNSTYTEQNQLSRRALYEINMTLFWIPLSRKIRPKYQKSTIRQESRSLKPPLIYFDRDFQDKTGKWISCSLRADCNAQEGELHSRRRRTGALRKVKGEIYRTVGLIQDYSGYCGDQIK